MRLSLDSNLLVYAFEEGDRRSETAADILRRARMVDTVLTNQVIGEFFNVVRRKHPQHLVRAATVAETWREIFPLIATETPDLIAAAVLSAERRLQYWDSVVVTVAARAGCAVLLSEDMQDGAAIGGVRLINPFADSNGALVDALLTPAPGTA